jgi:hypothetical protein
MIEFDWNYLIPDMIQIKTKQQIVKIWNNRRLNCYTQHSTHNCCALYWNTNYFTITKHRKLRKPTTQYNFYFKILQIIPSHDIKGHDLQRTHKHTKTSACIGYNR